MMRLNFSKRRVIQAAAAIACASALAASAAAGHTAYTYAPAASTAKAVEVGSYASAGATSLMSTLENAAYQEALTLSESKVSLTAEGTGAAIATAAEASAEAISKEAAVPEVVAAPVAEASAESVAEVPKDEWAARVCANVESELNVRAQASVDSEVVGYLRRGDVGEVVERANGWTKIISGNVTGYVRDDLLLRGQEAFAFVSNIHPVSATSTIDGLRVRADATVDSDIVTALNNGESAAVDLSYDTSAGWTKVTKGKLTGYVKNEYVTLGQPLSAGLTVEEYAQQKAAERAAEKAAEEAKKKAAAAKSSSQVAASGSTYKKNESVSASASDLDLLAALIYCEAGSESYEGQVAVGATVINRMKSGIYSNTIRGAIYDPWAYSPTWTGVLDRAIANGHFCYAAAQDAINGVDPTGGAMSFKLASSGHPGVVIGRVVFF